MATVTRGFALLIPTLLMSSALMLITLSASRAVYILNQVAYEAEDALQSRVQALSCLHTALFELVADHEYRPYTEGDYIQLAPTESCVIESITHSGSTLGIRVRGTSTLSVTRLEAEVLYNEIIFPSGIHLLSLKSI